MSSVKIKPLSKETVDQWNKVAWQVKQVQENFVNAYKASLHDIAGKDWKTTFSKWTNFVDVIHHLESETKAICLANGMDLTVFNRYRTAARKICFHSTSDENLPFKFAANFSVGDIQEAEQLAKKNKDGTLQQRLNKAYSTIRHRRQYKHAVQQASAKATVLPTPAEDEDAKAFRINLLGLLKTHLDKSSECLRGRDKSATALKTISDIVTDYVSGARTKVEIEEVA